MQAENQNHEIKKEIDEISRKLDLAKKGYTKTLTEFVDQNLDIKNSIESETNELKRLVFSSKRFLSHYAAKSANSNDAPDDTIVDIYWASENNNFSNQILYCDKDTAILVNSSTKKIVNQFKLSGQDLKTCAIEPTQNGLIAVGGIEGQVYVGEINTNTSSDRKEDNNNIKKHTGHQGSSDSLILLWDLNSQGKYLNSYHEHSSEILGLDVCELNPNFFASASGDTTVKLWDIRDKKPCICTFKGSDSSVNCVKFVPGTFCTLAAGSEEGIVRLYDMRAYGILAEYGKKDSKSIKNNNYNPNHALISNSINSICFSKSGQILFASSNNSNIITYWNVFDPDVCLNEFHHTDGNQKVGISQLALNSSGDTLAYAVGNGLYFLK